MLSYEYDGSVLILTFRGTTSDLQRSITYGEIVRNEQVPDAALAILDTRRADDDATDSAEVERRARVLVQGLGPKLGAAIAVIAPPRLAEPIEHFQKLSAQLGIRISVFRDEPEARQWLLTFR